MQTHQLGDTSAEQADRDDTWKALSDPTRRAILDALRSGPATTGSIAERFPISRIAVMRHLDVLATAGLVLNRKRGRERWHFVNLVPLMSLHERWSTPLSQSLGTGLVSLKSDLESPMPSDTHPTSDVSSLEIELEVEIASPPATVFAAVMETPGAWWGQPYLNDDALAMTIESNLGGAFVEVWPNGGLVLATVTGLRADEWIQLTGPFHLGAVHAVVELSLASHPTGTHLALSFRAHGLINEAMASAFTGGWHELIAERLKRFVEDGTRLGIDG